MIQRARVYLAPAAIAIVATGACHSSPAATNPAPAAVVEPARSTAAVPNDADDPAIWVDRRDPSRSLILGTDKIEKTGGLYVFGLDGGLRQSIAPLDRPNNVDVEYDVSLGGRTIDVAVVSERMQHRLRLFEVSAAGLTDLAPQGLPVLTSETGEASEPMGVTLFRRAADGAVFAIVAPKTGPADGYLWQYRLDAAPGGAPRATFVRRFGAFSRVGAEPGEIGEIEAVVTDDPLGYVYYSDERFGIRKYHADPDHPEANRELAAFGRSGYDGDREGLAIFRTGARTGFIVSSDQVTGGSRLHLFRREGGQGGPHDHGEVQVIATASDETDGLDVTSAALPGFPRGLLVMMSSATRNFLFYDWTVIAPGPAGRSAGGASASGIGHDRAARGSE